MLTSRLLLAALGSVAASLLLGCPEPEEEDMCAELPAGSVPLYGVCLEDMQCLSGVCFGNICMEACDYDEDCDTYPDGRCSPGGVGLGCNYACDAYPPEAFVNAECASETVRWTYLSVPSLCEACGEAYCH